MCLLSLLHGTGIRAGGTLVARGPVGPRLRALAGPAHALAPPAAQQAHAGHAGVGAPGAVAVLTLPVRGALAEAAVTDAVAWERRNDAQPKIAFQHLVMTPSLHDRGEFCMTNMGVVGVLEGKHELDRSPSFLVIKTLTGLQEFR